MHMHGVARERYWCVASNLDAVMPNFTTLADVVQGWLIELDTVRWGNLNDMMMQ